jgi:hypothetical protein
MGLPLLFCPIGQKLPLLQNQPRRPPSLHSSQGPLDSNGQGIFFTSYIPNYVDRFWLRPWETLPVHIRLGCPILGAEAHSGKKSGPLGHGGYLAPLKSSAMRDLNAPLVWQWWIFVCHHDLPYPSRAYIRLCDDACLDNIRGHQCLCDKWTGSAPGRS